MLVLEENLDDLATFISEKGADPNFVDPDDFTPLYVAVKHKLNECAKTLLAIQTQNTELVEFFERWLHTAETEWAAARREAASSTSSDQPSRKRRRVEADSTENGTAEAEGKK
ncbi:uncharacterized protein ACA1_135590 [Acanthamoeba castellanii str. Neff]|uniref:Uncharacterized protein n=1 Tax=Acanthamoeba castellanii (strain ATCC 30010 / Neff) TaxID=1257118 RepID=L8GE55_ACACF|nr:uncharacterized protein ACA1_135590 [Acanthamoeba castellanii str. Neff]ELR11380.1 hypothetical protein ACA1_135590 [Acanthamoeba castellanii str. Neff]